jgi:hypothetical protein
MKRYLFREGVVGALKLASCEDIRVLINGRLENHFDIVWVDRVCFQRPRQRLLLIENDLFPP